LAYRCQTEAERRPSTLRKLSEALNVQPRDLIEG
jgi:DNA-binding Xre family transcriptional regulator